MFVIIAGATGTGKSAAAVELAKMINGEIISADSMQVYRGMDIGTYKSTAGEMSGVPHHMIDIIDPGQAFSAADFKARAEQTMDRIKAAGRVPIIAGGTGLYINAVVKGMMKAAEPAHELKDGLRLELKNGGPEKLAARLMEIDPEAAASTDLKNSRRVLRALELVLANGKKLSELKAGTSKTAYDDVHVMFILEIPREELYKRLDTRVDFMIEKGLVDEVKTLIKQGVNQDTAAMQAIGYKETAAYLEGVCSLSRAVQSIKQATRNYAKRQETWFRKYPEAVRLNVSKRTAKQAAEEMAEILIQKSKGKSQK